MWRTRKRRIEKKKIFFGRRGHSLARAQLGLVPTVPATAALLNRNKWMPSSCVCDDEDQEYK
jgi:hypothetical protein